MKTYEAIIEGDKVTWTGERPTPGDDAIPVTIRVRERPLVGTDGAKLAAILREIAAEGGVTSFGDALAWQLEERVDRPLPGRE